MKFSSFLHILLLGYIIAALSFWWISLEKQSKVIYNNELATLNDHIQQAQFPKEYNFAKSKIELRKNNRSKQYLGEGITFLVITLIGSWIVYSNYRFSNSLSRQQNNFMLSVTHELKSPIAAMKLTLQTLQRHQLAPEKQQQLLSNCVKESNRLNELCDNVLIASQMEGGHYHKEHEEISISELVEDCFAEYELRYPNRFQTNIASGIVANTDKTLLRLVINNILENAIKYTSASSPIFIALSAQANKVIVAISDMGEGINDLEKKKIFKQFYRIGDEKTRNTKGTGLGLYLSKKIMDSLAGSIEVKDNRPKGSVFEIKIPFQTN